MIPARDATDRRGFRVLYRMSMQHHPWARASRQSPGRRSCAARAAPAAGLHLYVKRLLRCELQNMPLPTHGRDAYQKPPSEGAPNVSSDTVVAPPEELTQPWAWAMLPPPGRGMSRIVLCERFADWLCLCVLGPGCLLHQQSACLRPGCALCERFAPQRRVAICQIPKENVELLSPRSAPAQCT